MTAFSIFALARSWLGGNAAQAFAGAAIAAVIAASIGIGLAQMRHEAASTATTLCQSAEKLARVEAERDAFANAHAAGELTLSLREKKIEVLDGVVRKLEQEQANAREVGPGRDDQCVPGDSPWVQRGRTAR